MKFRASVFLLLISLFLPSYSGLLSFQPQYLDDYEREDRLRDERYRLLELKKAYVKLMDARTRYERAKDLLGKELISREKYNEMETEYLTTEVEYSKR